jgi:hypothetical protein
MTTSTATGFTAQDNRIAEVLMALESAPAMSIHAAPMVVLSNDRPPRPVLGLHADGRRWALSVDDALITACALETELPFSGARALAAGLRAGVGVTDLLVLRSRMQALRQLTASA